MSHPPPSTLIATLFGIGRIRAIPGTVGSAAALPVGWWISFFGGWLALVVASAMLAVLAIWASGRYAKSVANADPAECVIDEAAGQWLALVPLALAGLLFNAPALALAFLFFRALDALKPWPLSALERLPGGLGIVADDLLAGLVAGALVVALAAFGLV